MMQKQANDKIKAHHLSRKAVVYMRQSTTKQVRENLESQRAQRELQNLARDLGWREVEVLDGDLGCSAAVGARRREDFDRLVGSIARGEVGIIMAKEVSRFSRSDKDWCHLLEVCRVFEALPQCLRNVSYNGGRPLEDESVKAAIAAGEKRLGKTGRLLIRPSGTEPVIRVMAEGEDEDLIVAVVDDIAGVIGHAAR